ncbi:hypothetical protein [Nitrospirillum iridis]|uniref:Uncharacterized protein n=1 Tax=Nitrospirillum iridis TaxID=765888 RepID=A0A7X0EHI4_9PROT|nr:hypothetical protein [Nitrospirillum iridis]MBB6255166.1 hypothetical protein [Nitrospirillum iridis]
MQPPFTIAWSDVARACRTAVVRLQAVLGVVAVLSLALLGELHLDHPDLPDEDAAIEMTVTAVNAPVARHDHAGFQGLGDHEHDMMAAHAIMHAVGVPPADNQLQPPAFVSAPWPQPLEAQLASIAPPMEERPPRV